MPVMIFLIGTVAVWTDLSSKKNAPRMTGIEAMKENLNASSLSAPLNKRVVIVVPDLEIPGIIAMAWEKPIIRLSFFEIRLFPSLKNFVEINIRPFIRKARKMYFELNKDSRWSLNVTPMMPVTRDASNIFIKSCLSRKAFMISLKKNVKIARIVPEWSITSV